MFQLETFLAMACAKQRNEDTLKRRHDRACKSSVPRKFDSPGRVGAISSASLSSGTRNELVDQAARSLKRASRVSKDELRSYRLLIPSNHSKTLPSLWPEKEEAIVFDVRLRRTAAEERAEWNRRIVHLAKIYKLTCPSLKGRLEGGLNGIRILSGKTISMGEP